jgi:hypothetical protein
MHFRYEQLLVEIDYSIETKALARRYHLLLPNVPFKNIILIRVAIYTNLQSFQDF